MNALSRNVACSNCNLRELSMPSGLTPEQLERIDHLVTRRMRIKRGQSLPLSLDAGLNQFRKRTKSGLALDEAGTTCAR